MNSYTLVITQGDPRCGDQRENEVRRIEGLSYHQALKGGDLWHKLGHWASVYHSDGALVAELEGDDCYD